MNVVEKVNRAVWNLFEMTKQIAKENLNGMIQRGDIVLDANQVEALVKLFDASVEQAYHRGCKSISTLVGGFLNK